jgi:hypothetical protein
MWSITSSFYAEPIPGSIVANGSFSAGYASDVLYRLLWLPVAGATSWPDSICVLKAVSTITWLSNHALRVPRSANLAGTPISEVVTDLFGRRFTYAGAAPRKGNGTYDVDSLRPGEFIVEPGLLYRLEPGKRATRDAAKNSRSSLAPSPQLPSEVALENPKNVIRVLSAIARTLGRRK